MIFSIRTFRKAIIFSLIFFLVKIAYSQKNLIIYGKAPFFNDNSFISITSFYPYKAVFDYPKKFDSTIILNHRFKLSLKVENAELYIIKAYDSVTKSTSSGIIFLEPGSCRMVLKDSILEDIVVFGNDAAKDYTDFKRKISHIKPPPEYYSYNKAYKNSLLANDTLTSNYFYRKKDSIEATIKDSYIGIVKNWINKKKTSLINSQIIRTYLFDNLTDLQIKKIFYSLPLQGRINSWGKEIEIYFSALSIGKNLPTFLLRDTSNITINLNSFKGSFVFLDFWASWCIPCREQSEKIMSVYNNYKGKGLKLICISLDKVADDWKKAILKDRLDCINVCDLQGFDGIAKLYMIKSIPANFLIDKQGKIIAKNIKIDELEKLLTSRIK